MEFQTTNIKDSIYKITLRAVDRGVR